jgi:excisionase family DNA binding protein
MTKSLITGAPTQTAGDGPMLTPEQVAELLAVSKSTLSRLTKRGAIPHKRLGDRIVRYDRTEILAWIRARS